MTRDRRLVSQKYDLLAHFYDWFFRTYTKKTIGHAIAAADLKGVEKIFDIGCGTGALEEALLPQFPGLEISGCDLSAGMIARALQKLAGRTQVTLFIGDFLQLPMEPGRFDIVFALSNLHYFPNPQGVLQKASEIVKPGGQFVLVDWVGDTLRGKLYQFWMKSLDRAFKKAYSVSEMEALFRQTGWTIEKAKPFSVQGFWTMVALRARK